jgi:uncharacterized surface protein with fasciclin (FAS1) repeats
MRSLRKYVATVAVVSGLGLLAACGSDEPAQSATNESTSEAPAVEESPSEEADMGGESMGTLAGPGCTAYAEQVPDGDGSVQGMAEDPVAVAASNNPLLKTLTAAVSGEFNPDVDLVDTLNGDEFTVFAPVDEAFAKLPEDTVASLAKPANAEQLTAILTYHVVPGRIAPEEIAGTTQTTVQGGEVELSGDPEALRVNDAAVVCGGVQTANATVYLIDSVLMPPM